MTGKASNNQILIAAVAGLAVAGLGLFLWKRKCCGSCEFVVVVREFFLRNLRTSTSRLAQLLPSSRLRNQFLSSCLPVYHAFGLKFDAIVHVVETSHARFIAACGDKEGAKKCCGDKDKSEKAESKKN